VIEEHIMFSVEEELYNFDTHNTCNIEGMDERLIFYDWMADSATSSHITHQRKAFTTYTPITNKIITGVGGKEAIIAGQGTVELVSMCKGQSYTPLLENVLHVDGIRNI
jgi:hypothetical protein